MFSIRSFARSAPRTVSRLSASAIRQSSRTSISQQAWKPARTQAIKSFSSSAARREKLGESDEELALKLDSELQIEKDMKDKEGAPMSVSDYLQNGPFEVIDTPGQEDVILTRQFGEEKYDDPYPVCNCAMLIITQNPNHILNRRHQQPRERERIRRPGHGRRRRWTRRTSRHRWLRSS